MREEYENSIRNFGAPVGPRLPLLRSPEVTAAWDSLAKALAKSEVPRRLRELVIITVGATWKADFEWYIHSQEARRYGLSPQLVEEIRLGREPRFDKEDERILYAYSMELQRSHRVSDQTYDAARKLFGDRALAELTVLIGHYTMVSMTLNAHEAPLPAGVPPQF
jgi:4-carboxymuconolactone decarboxylase